MTKPSLFISILLSLVVLSGCASMSAEECQTTHWGDLGYQEGQSGANPTVISDYAKDCGENGISVDKAAWQKGYNQGLILYCSPANGYREGASGKTYHGVCDNQQFVAQYQLGRQQYLKEQRLEKIEREISDIDLKLSNKQGLDEDERKRLNRVRDSLVSERGQLLSTQYRFELNL
ncbi:conserved hypothetical protein [Vibrio nigripulchritudo SOn1]|uniref:ATPase involved in DNA repair n=1 Tax=Vibrio nigripulchritudo SOn1 TaxID=1238450 RepID=A0AAV2VI88_9VIBR|nr:DUF2799 domain-containing protein [Vibrio nigripulchritudo]CCO44382.1 conserved hypothetical protein [Vibrio nigripulchritudo SOn1]